MTGRTKATKPCFIYHTKPSMHHNMGLTEADNNDRKCIVIKQWPTFFKETWKKVANVLGKMQFRNGKYGFWEVTHTTEANSFSSPYSFIIAKRLIEGTVPCEKNGVVVSWLQRENKGHLSCDSAMSCWFQPPSVFYLWPMNFPKGSNWKSCWSHKAPTLDFEP